MSMKAKIKNIAKEKNISAQAVLQVHLTNRFLFRLAQSKYKDMFVIKGGVLISSIIGIDQRTTMDLDTTIRNIPLNEIELINVFNKICNIQLGDGIQFVFEYITPIREDDEYGGYRLAFKANYGKINAPMTIDISTGDVITPAAIEHSFVDLIDKKQSCELWSYPIETILAEKIETVLSQSTENTRPRDYYDLYKLSFESYDSNELLKALLNTSTHRGSRGIISNYKNILRDIKNSDVMNQRWNKYSGDMFYAKDIVFEDIINIIEGILDDLLL